MFKFSLNTRLIRAGLVASVVIGISSSAGAQQANYKNTRAYKDAYACGKESLQSDPTGNSTVSYCIGNSHDPSKIELQAFKDAVSDAKASSKAKKSQ